MATDDDVPKKPSIEEIVAMLRKRVADSHRVSPGPWRPARTATASILDASRDPVIWLDEDNNSLDSFGVDINLIVDMRNHIEALLDAVEGKKP